MLTFATTPFMEQIEDAFFGGKVVIDPQNM
jgi:hypothetical protein